MFTKNSIRRRFLLQLIFSSASLILIFSSILYFYIEKSIYDEKITELTKYARNIANFESISQSMDTENPLSLSIETVTLQTNNISTDIYEKTVHGHTYLTVIYPFNIQEKIYLKVTKDITPTRKLLDKIIKYIFIINIAGFLLVILYAITLSKMLVTPVETLSKKLSNMNEHLMKPIKIEELPYEFEPLGETINRLIGRIQNFVKYQKELFIGTAHELKTPLAVIKLKNQVTLIKKRTPE
jgi:two-component system OmpR family sensor kinase